MDIDTQANGPGALTLEKVAEYRTTMDYSAWVKRKYGGYSEQISEQDRRYLRFSWPERVARLFWWPWRLLTTLHRRLIAPRN